MGDTTVRVDEELVNKAFKKYASESDSVVTKKGTVDKALKEYISDTDD